MRRAALGLGGDERGSSAIEMVIFVPAWLLAIATVVQLSLVWTAVSLLHRAATVGDRVAIVTIPTEEPLEPPNVLGPRKEAEVDAAVSEALAPLGHFAGDRLRVSITGARGQSDRFDETEPVRVEAELDLPLEVPLVGAVLGHRDPVSGDWVRTLRAATVMRNEGASRRPAGTP